MRCETAVSPALFALLLLSASVAGLAAGDTVGGRVLDENGIPVSGVRIVVSSQAGSAAPAAVSSDAAGAFHLQLPLAGVYQVRAEHEGFFLFQSQPLTLDPASPLEIRINHVKELTETVDVRYSQPVIDPEQTSEVKQLHAPDILNVPRPASQDFRNALPMMPGAVQASDAQIHFNGARTYETNYRLNGFDLSDPATNALTATLNIDTIQTLQWDASRVSPENGRGSAGTLDIRTEMGDNHWRVAAANLVPGIASQDGVYLNHWAPRALFSGPILKDRLWFHNASDVFYAADTIAQLPSGQNRTSSLSGSNLTRLQWNVGARQILTGSFLLNMSDVNRNGLSFLSPAETTVDRRQSLLLGSVRDQFLWGSGLLEIGFANTAVDFRASPQGMQPYIITPLGATGNFLRDEHRRSQRQEWLIDGFVRPLHWLGTHQLQAGANVERSGLDELIVRHTLSVVRTDNSPVRLVEFEGSPRQFRTNVDTYGYLLDKWSPSPQFTLEAGIRYRWDADATGSMPSPTLAAAWAPKHSGGMKISAGWGIWFDAVPLRTLALGQEQTSYSTYYSASGIPVGVPLQTRFLLNPADVRMARYSVASLSVERALPGNLFGKASLTSRQGSRGAGFVESSLDAANNDYVLANIERQRYRAAEFSLRRTFLAKYQWFASYTRSEARSSAVLAYSIENPLLAPQAGGPLAWDAPNRALTWGWLPVSRTWFPHFLRPLVGETDFQLLADYRSGFPFTVTSETGRLVGEPNSRRFPDYCSVNVALERKFPFHGYIWALRLGLVNAFDRQNADVVNSDFDSPRFLQFGGGQSRATNIRLRFVGRK